jgi:toxin ParE1/3/4
VKEIVHDPEVPCDIFGAVRFYEDRVPGLGARFLRALDDTTVRIAGDPQRFGFYVKPIRSVRVPGFPYRVLFTDEAEFVLILAVAHLSRQPGWWRYRTERE